VSAVGAHILVVEDTPHNLQLMTYLLEAHGHTVDGADTGERAVEHAAQSHPDLVVMDLQLSGIDGYQALHALRALPNVPAVPVIAVTSFAMVGDRDLALAAGFDHYMTKPIDPETFTTEIESYLPEHLHGARQSRQWADPLDSAAAERPTPPGAATVDVLVLDDSPTNLALLRSMLEPSGYHVRTSSTVDEAIAAVDATRPDVVLSDVHVGQQRGTELLAHLRAVPELAAIPFAFLTSTAIGVDWLANDRNIHVIFRPIEPAALLDEVKTLVTNRAGV
jgi:two-component system cell cycle response regulator